MTPYQIERLEDLTSDLERLEEKREDMQSDLLEVEQEMQEIELLISQLKESWGY